MDDGPIGAWGLIALLWFGGLLVYFVATSREFRETALTVVWSAMGLTVIYGAIKLLL